jgi:DNA-binding NarL/FixJ family response regulator
MEVSPPPSRITPTRPRPSLPAELGYRLTFARSGEAAKTIPIIAVTAHAFPGFRERCLAAGMNGYIPKRTDTKALSRTLDVTTCPRGITAGPNGSTRAKNALPRWPVSFMVMVK